MSLIKKENLTISIGEYQDKSGATKQEWRTIGELITMQGNDGPYQFFKLWGASGTTEGKVFEQRDKNAQQAPQQAPQQQQAPRQNYQQQAPQQQQQQQQQQQAPQQQSGAYNGDIPGFDNNGR